MGSESESVRIERKESGSLKNNPALSTSLDKMPKEQQEEVAEGFKKAVMWWVNSKKINLSQDRAITKDEKYKNEAQISKNNWLPTINDLDKYWKNGDLIDTKTDTVYTKVPLQHNTYYVRPLNQKEILNTTQETVKLYNDANLNKS